MHSVHYDPSRRGRGTFLCLDIYRSTLPRVSVHFCWALRARQKCTLTLGKVDAINIETKEGRPPLLGEGHNALSALGDLPPS